MNKKLYTSIVLSILLLQGCMKQTELSKELTCRHIQEYSITNGDTSALNYHFDELNRLVYVDRPEGTDDSISYEPGKITIHYVPKQDEFYTIFYLNSASLAASCETYIYGELNDKRYFTYTPEGYLATIRDSTKSAVVDYTLSYTDGNLTEYETSYNTIRAVTRLEYYPEDVKFWTYLNTIYFVGNCTYYPWLGKHSKKLPKSIRFERVGFNTLYTYELDEKGYIKKRTSTWEDFNTSYDSFMEHECR